MICKRCDTTIPDNCTVSHSTQFCWTLLYPAALYFIVGTLSPIWLPILIGAAVYAIAATYTTVYLFRTGLFI